MEEFVKSEKWEFTITKWVSDLNLMKALACMIQTIQEENENPIEISVKFDQEKRSQIITFWPSKVERRNDSLHIHGSFNMPVHDIGYTPHRVKLEYNLKIKKGSGTLYVGKMLGFQFQPA